MFLIENTHILSYAKDEVVWLENDFIGEQGGDLPNYTQQLKKQVLQHKTTDQRSQHYA